MHVRKHIPRLWHGGHHAWLPIEVRTHSQTDAPRQTTIQYGARGKSVSNPWYTLCICLPVLLHVSYLYARNLFALRTGTLVDNLEKGNGDIMTFKPMLAGTMKDTSKLHFPMLASQKLDGIRATVQGGQLLSQILKPIPNENVQALFKGLPEGIDGELIVGDPLAPDAYRKTVSLVMSDDKPLDWFKGEVVRLHVFDKYGSGGFQSRLHESDR